MPSDPGGFQAGRGAAPRQIHVLDPAEGAANDFFDERNRDRRPKCGRGVGQITLLPENAAPIVVPTFTIAASSRYTFSVRPAMNNPFGASVSAVVEGSSHASAARRGTDDDVGVRSAPRRPQLAGRAGHGAQVVPRRGTTGFFSTYILIANPDPNQDAIVQVKYLREIGDPLTQTLTVPKNGRVTIDVNSGLDSTTTARRRRRSARLSLQS